MKSSFEEAKALRRRILRPPLKPAGSGNPGPPPQPVTRAYIGKNEPIVPTVGAAPLPVIVLFPRVSNYFKHRDEWPHKEWKALTGQTRTTVLIITAIGASRGNTGNLRKGAEVLGLPDYVTLNVLYDHIASWSDGIVDAYRSELSTRGLI